MIDKKQAGLIYDRKAIHEDGLMLLVQLAKQEVFDDLKLLVERKGLVDLENCTCIDCSKFRKVRNKHLHPIIVKAISVDTDTKNNVSEKP